ncbi:DsbA family oxidoreductase [Bradyrhizobium sp. SYSU BS000235]|uniref:DsbA family oxidoreductase n=1 Tax=Bradyrhizobium sp. SYSU BS000235 TaxID=3411332 RepID=UPI003C728207
MSGSLVSAPPVSLQHVADEGPVALHWYDLTCPFCYLGQARTHLLQQRGLTVIELPFQAHAEIPAGGINVGPRQGPMYQQIERNAAALGLPLNWPPRLPNSGIALAAAEWVRRHQPDAFAAVQTRLFRAHFADGLDIGDLETVLKCTSEFVTDLDNLRAALTSGEARVGVYEGQRLGEDFGVRGTPSWRIAGQMISGYITESEFERVAARALPQPTAKAS